MKVCLYDVAIKIARIQNRYRGDGRKQGMPLRPISRNALDEYGDSVRDLYRIIQKHNIPLWILRDTVYDLLPKEFCHKAFNIPFPPVPVICCQTIQNEIIRRKRQLRDQQEAQQAHGLGWEWQTFRDIRDSRSTQLNEDALAKLLVNNDTLSEEWYEQWQGRRDE